LGMVSLLRHHDSYQPCYKTAGRGRTQRFGVLAHRTSERRTSSLLPTPAYIGTDRSGTGAVVEFDLLVGGTLGLDIRLPIGAFFALIGLMLCGYGLVSDKAVYQQSLGINVNLEWGIVLLVFGLIMAFLGRKTAKQ